MSLKNLLLALASTVEAPQKSEAGRRAGSPEEYAALRTEMTQIQVNVRTLWTSVFALFVTGAGALLALLTALLRDKDDLRQFLKLGGLNWTSALFLSFLVSGMYLTYLWLRHTYYIGSYIIAAHEDENKELQWLTRNRGVQSQTLRKYSLTITTGFGHSSWFLLIFGSLPWLIGLVWINYIKLWGELSFSFFWGGLCAVLMLYVLFFVQYFGSAKAWKNAKK